MAHFALRGIDPDLLARAKVRARERGERLDRMLVAWLTAYVAGWSPAADFGRRGGYARAKALTDNERSASARKAATARWSGRVIND